MQLNECVSWVYGLDCLMFAPARLSVAKNKGLLPYKQPKSIGLIPDARLTANVMAVDMCLLNVIFATELGT
jgi:hypothetical protein